MGKGDKRKRKRRFRDRRNRNGGGSKQEQAAVSKAKRPRVSPKAKEPTSEEQMIEDEKKSSALNSFQRISDFASLLPQIELEELNDQEEEETPLLKAPVVTKSQPSFPKSEYDIEEFEPSEKALEAASKIRKLLHGRNKTVQKTNDSGDADFLLLPKRSKEFKQTPIKPTKTESTSERPAWLVVNDTKRGTVPKDGTLWLHNEILEFVDFIKPSKKESEARQKIVNIVESSVKRIWPGATTHVFGSVANGLCIPGSDVDLVVFNAPRNAIEILANSYRDENMVDYMEVITNAKIPIIKLRFKDTAYTADICFDQQGGPKTGAMIRKMLSDIPTLRPLILVIKYFLMQREMNETYRGGIGSHLCLLTVASMLQHSRRKLLREKYELDTLDPTVPIRRYEDLGSLLLEYLELYGQKLNIPNVGISLKCGGSYMYKNAPKEYSKRVGVFYVENPEETGLDIGKSAYAISKVKRAFDAVGGVLRYKLSEFARNPPKGKPTSLLSSVICCDQLLKERYKQRTQGSLF